MMMANTGVQQQVTWVVASEGNPPPEVAYQPATGELTPDTLMAYCQSRLNSIDSQVESSFNQQSAYNQERSDISDALQVLQSNPSGTTDPATCRQMEQTIEDLVTKIKAIDPNSPSIPKLEQLHDNMMATGSGPYTDSNGTQHTFYTGNITGRNDQDNDIGADEMNGFIKTLSGVNDDLNSNSELQMIQLQSLMSQRQTAIQLTTNLVQSLGDQTDKIAENIGH